MSAVVNIGIAEVKAVSSPDKIRTTLGSCVGVALFDRASAIGGMAHVMLPDSSSGHGDPGKFADTAVDWLVEEVVGAGAAKSRLIAKITGGASMFGPVVDNGLGERNVAAVRDRLSHHSIALTAQDVGGRKGRRMMLDPSTGQVTVQVIGEEARTV